MSNLGVWIDRHKAVIVALGDRDDSVRTILAEDPPAHRGDDASHSRNDFTPEDRLERKATHSQNQFYDSVITALPPADALLVFGPSETKLEFVKRIEKSKSNHLQIHTETADKLADHEIVARVKHFFLTTTKPAKP